MSAEIIDLAEFNAASILKRLEIGSDDRTAQSALKLLYYSVCQDHRIAYKAPTNGRAAREILISQILPKLTLFRQGELGFSCQEKENRDAMMLALICGKLLPKMHEADGAQAVYDLLGEDIFIQACRIYRESKDTEDFSQSSVAADSVVVAQINALYDMDCLGDLIESLNETPLDIWSQDMVRWKSLIIKNFPLSQAIEEKWSAVASMICARLTPPVKQPDFPFL